MDFSTISDNRQNVSFTSEFAEISPIILPCYLLLRMFITMVTCKHQLHLPAALLWALVLNHSTNGFLGSSCSNSNNDKLMARRMRLVATNTPSSPMLGRSSCLYERRSYDDKSDEELFAALLVDKKSKASDATASLSSLDTSRYAHLANITSPSPSIKPEDIIPLVMNALKNNDVPDKDAGMKLVWEFATDTTQYVFRNNRTGE